MKILKCLFAALMVITISVNARAQGLNNKYSIDSVDIKSCLELLGLEVFKFPIQTEKSCKIDFIVEEYKNGTLVNTESYMDGLKNMPEEYLAFMTPKADSNLNWFRLYCYDQNDTSMVLKINYDGMVHHVPFHTDASLIHAYRAFDFKGLKAGEKKPMVLRYAKKVSPGDVIHCPAGLGLDKIVENYEHVIVVFIKAQEEE